jgi:hypothetical protein
MVLCLTKVYRFQIVPKVPMVPNVLNGLNSLNFLNVVFTKSGLLLAQGPVGLTAESGFKLAGSLSRLLLWTETDIEFGGANET